MHAQLYAAFIMMTLLQKYGVAVTTVLTVRDALSRDRRCPMLFLVAQDAIVAVFIQKRVAYLTSKCLVDLKHINVLFYPKKCIKNKIYICTCMQAMSHAVKHSAWQSMRVHRLGSASLYYAIQLQFLEYHYHVPLE
jgi:hypothetical protein